MYRLGIDIGSKTAKMVLLDDKDKIVFSQYSLHRSNVLQTFSELLGNTIWRSGNHEVETCVTGSSGMRFAQDLGLPYVQEVIASRCALQTYLPEVDVAIELGGEDAKILFLSNGVEERMNGSCAGGTGGFLDLMCGMLSVKARDFNALAAAYTHVYPIASRCAVFAQADVRPLINAGARKSDIAASVMQAIVTQTISGLACGRAIEGNVAFLGGPCEVYSELIQRFRKTLHLTQAQTFKPDNAHLFVASGAALIAGSSASQRYDSDGIRVSAQAARQESCTLQNLKDRIDALPLEQDGSLARRPQLFAIAEELEAFKKRHEANKVVRSRLMDYEGEIFVGVDAGSTALKLAAINTKGELLYSAYESNQGNVVESMRKTLDEFYRAMPREYDGTPLTTVQRSLVCGYGEALLKAAFHLESGEVETVAHLRAAQEFCADASFVLDIGGQDIKCLRLSNGQIDDIMLNEACSSGCGALIQGFARSLGHTQWTFASEALKSESPVDLGTRCTVFMTSRVRHAQKEGVSTADISAGLAYSVVRNALYKVMGVNNISQLGEKVVVQGGTFMNDAVLRAFELESGLEVVRPDIANLMGAYGAALLARDEYLDSLNQSEAAPTPTILSMYELAALKQKQSNLRCQACANECNLAVSSFYFADEEEQNISLAKRRFERMSPASSAERQVKSEDSLFVSGNRCERGALWAAKQLSTKAKAKSNYTKQPTNLMAYEQSLSAQGAKGDAPSKATGKALSKASIKATAKAPENAPAMAPGEAPGNVPDQKAHKPLLGIPPVLGLYEHVAYWHTLFTELGFAVLPLERSSGEIYRRGAGAVLSESVCYPAKLMHGHISQLIAEGADYIFMPTFEETEGVECPVVSGYGHLAAHDIETFSSGKATLLTTSIKGQLPSAQDMRELVAKTDIFATNEAIRSALAVAKSAEQGVLEQLEHKAKAELEQLERKGGKGIVLLGHPYHSDPGINHTIDQLLGELGYPVFSVASLERIALAEASQAPVDLLAEYDVPALEWTQAARLYSVARFVAGHPQLHAIQLHSFGCGLDALTTTTIRQILQDAGKPYTAIKLDEMVEPATLRIRLRSLDYALGSSTTSFAVPLADGSAYEEWSASVEAAELEASATALLEHEPAARLEHEPVARACTELDNTLLPPVSAEDVEHGLALLNNDLCYQMLALGGQVLRWMEENDSDCTVLLPRLCKNCRGVELERVLNQVLPNSQHATITAENGARTAAGGVSVKEGDAVSVACCDAPADGCETAEGGDAPTEEGNAPVLIPGRTPPPASSDALTEHTAPRIGVLGNAAMLLTPEFNDLLFDKIRKEGALPVLPNLDKLFACNEPLPELLPELYEQGIRNFVFVQSFGCLHSHVGARGVLPEIKANYPDCTITFLEYDPGISQVNQLSRLKLAVSIAFEQAV